MHVCLCVQVYVFKCLVYHGSVVALLLVESARATQRSEGASDLVVVQRYYRRVVEIGSGDMHVVVMRHARPGKEYFKRMKFQFSVEVRIFDDSKLALGSSRMSEDVLTMILRR